MKLNITMGAEYGDAGRQPEEPARQLLGSTLPRVFPVQVHESDDEVVVVTGEAGRTPGLLVQVTSPSPQNPIHRAFRALRAIGIQIAHARVWLEYGCTVQVLLLRELDDQQPPAYRVPEVLEALRSACRLPRDPESGPTAPRKCPSTVPAAAAAATQ